MGRVAGGHVRQALRGAALDRTLREVAQRRLHLWRSGGHCRSIGAIATWIDSGYKPTRPRARWGPLARMAHFGLWLLRHSDATASGDYAYHEGYLPAGEARRNHRGCEAPA